MSQVHPPVVFLGPTLSWSEADTILPAIYLPPARQGDIYRAVMQYAPPAIGIIDGLFLHVAAVWHREILWSLSQGVHVFGASSMGALRAAELAPFGMRGVGRIYTAYSEGQWPGYDEPFEDDDEVAVIHAPMEAGGAALSDAMVDLRDTLLAAEAARVVDRSCRDALTATMKSLHFRERSFARLAECAAGTALAEWLPHNIIRRKRLDAVEMLATMREMLGANPAPFQATFRFERALVWEQFVAEADALDDTEALVLEELRLDPEEWQQVRRVVLGRLGPLQAADPTAERRQAEQFRRQRGLWRRAQLDEWLRANALDLTRLERLLRKEAALNQAATQAGPALYLDMIEHLRLTGRFAELLRNAKNKQTALANVPPTPADPHLSAIVDWYFEQRLGVTRPNSIPAFAAEMGWDSERDFLLAVWREYLFHKTLQ